MKNVSALILVFAKVISKPLYISFCQQILVFIAQSCDISVKLHAIDHLPLVSTFFIHSYIRAARNAAFWWSVQFSRRNTTDQLQHLPHCSAHCLPSKWMLIVNLCIIGSSIKIQLFLDKKQFVEIISTYIRNIWHIMFTFNFKR